MLILLILKNAELFFSFWCTSQNSPKCGVLVDCKGNVLEHGTKWENNSHIQLSNCDYLPSYWSYHFFLSLPSLPPSFLPLFSPFFLPSSPFSSPLSSILSFFSLRLLYSLMCICNTAYKCLRMGMWSWTFFFFYHHLILKIRLQFLSSFSMYRYSYNRVVVCEFETCTVPRV